MIKKIVLISVAGMMLSVGSISPFIFRTMWNVNQLAEKVNSGELQKSLNETLENTKKFATERQESFQKAAADSQENAQTFAAEQQTQLAAQQESAQTAAANSQENAQTFAAAQQKSAQEAAASQQSSAQTFATDQQNSAQTFAADRQKSAQKTATDAQVNAQTFAADQQAAAQQQVTDMQNALKAEVDAAKAELNTLKADLKAEKEKVDKEFSEIRAEIEAEKEAAKQQFTEEKSALQEQLAQERESLNDEWQGTRDGLAEAQADLESEFSQAQADLEDGFTEREQALKDEMAAERTRLDEGLADLKGEIQEREDALKTKMSELEAAGAEKVQEIEDKAATAEKNMLEQQAAFQAQMKADREAFLEEMRQMKANAGNEYTSAKDKASRLEEEMREETRKAKEYAAQTEEELREEGRGLRTDYEKARDSATDYAQTKVQRQLAEQLADTIVVQPSSYELAFYLHQVEEGILHTVMLQDPESTTIKLITETDASNLKRFKAALIDDLEGIKEDQLADIEEDAEVFAAYQEQVTSIELPIVLADKQSQKLAQLLAEFDAGLYDDYLNSRERKRLGDAKRKFRTSLQNIVRARIVFLGDDLNAFTDMYRKLASDAVGSAKNTGKNAIFLGKFEALRIATSGVVAAMIIPNVGNGGVAAADKIVREYKIKAAKVRDDLKKADLMDKAESISDLVDDVAQAYLDAYTNAIELAAGKTQIQVLFAGSKDEIAPFVRAYESKVGAFKNKVNGADIKGRLGVSLVQESLDDVKGFTGLVRAAEEARREGGEALVAAQAEASLLRETTPEIFEGIADEATAIVEEVAKTPKQLQVLSKYELLELETGELEGDMRIVNLGSDLLQIQRAIKAYKDRAADARDELNKAADLTDNASIKEEFSTAAENVPNLIARVVKAYFDAYMVALEKEVVSTGARIEETELDDLSDVIRSFESRVGVFKKEVQLADNKKKLGESVVADYLARVADEYVAAVREAEQTRRSGEIDEQERDLTVSSR